MIDVYPRYAELLARRGTAADAGRPARGSARFSADDLRDLQVWQKLAWIDPFYLDGDARVRRAGRQGRQFTRGRQGACCASVELELLNAVIPDYRDAAARGPDRALDLAVLPPDSAAAVRYATSTCGPTRTRACRASRFVHPEDAAEQLERAPACHERLFGRRPVGLWPSEGSVSDAMVPLAAAAGLHVDGDRRADPRADARASRSRRDGRGQVEQPDRLYAPYIVRGRRRGGRLRVPRSRAVGSDWVHLRRLGGRRGGRRLRRPARGGGPPVRGPRPAGERRSSRSSWTARMPGSISRAAAGRSCGRSTGGLPPIPSCGPSRWARPAGAAPHELTGIFPGLLDRRELLHLDRPSPTTSAPGASWPTPAQALDAAGDGRRRRRRRGRARKSSSPKAATGSGGTATTIRPTTTSSSTTCSGGTCGMSTAC